MEEQNRGSRHPRETILWGKSALPPSGNPYNGECWTDRVAGSWFFVYLKVLAVGGMVVNTPSTINISSARDIREIASSRSLARTISLAISES